MLEKSSEKDSKQAPSGSAHSPSCVGTAVGVQLAEDAIRMARRVGSRIEAVKSVPIPAGVVLSSPEYAKILTRALQGFCGFCGRVNIWATASFPGMSQRNLSLPNVPSRQLSMAVRWALRRELSSSLKGMFVDYTVVGESIGQGGKRTSVVACAVREQDVARITQIFAEAGYPLDGLTIPGCSLSHLVDRGGMRDAQRDSIFLHIGGESSHILLWSRGRVIVNREFRLGVSSFLDAAIGEASSAGMAHQFLSQICAADSAVAGLPGESRAAIMEAFGPVLHRLMRQFDLTLEAGTMNSSDLDLRQLHLSGPLAGCPEVRDFIRSHVGLPVVELNPLRAPFTDEEGASRDGEASDGWYVTACGLAFSDGAGGLNLLNPTQSTLEREERQNLNRIVFLVFLVLSLVGISVWSLFSFKARGLEKEHSALQVQLAGAVEVLDTTALGDVVTQLEDSEARRIEGVRRELALAVIAELAQRTSDSVEWVSIDVSMAAFKERTGEEPPQGSGTVRQEISVTGLVHGDPTREAADLAAYQILLGESPLVTDVRVDRSESKVIDGRTVLSFRMIMTPVQPSGRAEEQE